MKPLVTTSHRLSDSSTGGTRQQIPAEKSPSYAGNWIPKKLHEPMKPGRLGVTHPCPYLPPICG